VSLRASTPWPLALALLAALLVVPPRAAAGDRPRVEVHADGGSARVTFAWDAPTRAELARAGRSLRLSFDRPLPETLRLPRAELAPWLASLRRTGRAGELMAELREGVGAGLATRDATTLALILARAPARTAPGEAGAEPARATARSSRQAGLGRLILEGQRTLEVEPTRRGRELVLKVRPAPDPVVAGRALSLSPWVTGTDVSGGSLRLRLAPGVGHRLRRDGPARVVLDLAFEKTSPQRAGSAALSVDGRPGRLASGSPLPPASPPTAARRLRRHARRNGPSPP
jgi:hypothetical protein